MIARASGSPIQKMIRNAALVMMVALSQSACGDKTEKRSTVEAESTSAMVGAATPGMPPASDSNSVTLTAAQIEHGKIAWGPPEIGQMTSGAVIPGTVIPNENRTARLSAPAEGRITVVRIQPGDRVGRGQILVTLVGPGAGSAQSDVTKARAQVVAMRAQAGYAAAARSRAERLLALKAIPRQDYERAVADDEAARASLSQAIAEERRALSSAEQLGAGASPTGEMVLRSPLSGVVLSRSAQPGAVVSAGTQLVSVTDPSSLWLQVSAPEKLASLFQVGGILHFTVTAYPGERFDARINAVGAALDPDTRTLLVRATVLNGTQKLKPEMLASVAVESREGSAVPIVPDSAVQIVNGQPSVFIVKPNNLRGATFVRRSVEVGTRTGSKVAVVKGLSPGELVVTSGAFSVKAQLQKGSMPGMEM